MIGSLQSRLTLALVAVLGASLLLMGVAVHQATSRALWHELDTRLMQEAESLAGMVEEHDDGQWEFEAGALDELQRGNSWFEVRLDDGTVLSTSDAGPPTPRDAPSTADLVRLPDGRTTRAQLVKLPPAHDAAETFVHSGRLVTVVVGQDVSDTEATLARLRWVLIVSALIVLLASSAAGAWVVRRGLAPLRQLAVDVEQIDVRRLSTRIDVAGLPREIQPPIVRLNGLLERLELAFAREQEFSGDVSHELRTPLSGLRATLELAVSRPRSVDEHTASLQQSLSIVFELTKVVENLLLLQRVEQGAVEAGKAPVQLHPLVERCFAPHSDAAMARGLRFENRVTEPTTLMTDESLLAIVLGNLLSNAAAYTEDGGWISVEGDANQIVVSDSGPPIPPESLPRLFDRFYRVDASRHGGAHAGIGLSIVRAVAQAIGMTVRVENAGRVVRFVVATRTD